MSDTPNSDESLNLYVQRYTEDTEKMEANRQKLREALPEREVSFSLYEGNAKIAGIDDFEYLVTSGGYFALGEFDRMNLTTLDEVVARANGAEPPYTIIASQIGEDAYAALPSNSPELKRFGQFEGVVLADMWCDPSRSNWVTSLDDTCWIIRYGNHSVIGGVAYHDLYDALTALHHKIQFEDNSCYLFPLTVSRGNKTPSPLGYPAAM